MPDSSPLENKKAFLQAISPKRVFATVLIILIAINSSKLFDKLKDVQKRQALAPFSFHGIKFSGLNDVLKNQQYVGYYTDKDLDVNQNALQFAQAQFTLAPIVLDLDYQKHEYIFFDCSSELIANQKIAELRATAIRKNSFGIILARKKK